MNNELLEALNILEQEKNISKDTLLEAIETSLVTACKNHFGKSDNVKVEINRDTCEFNCYQEKTVVETVEDPVEEISLVDAHMIDGKYQLGDANALARYREIALENKVVDFVLSQANVTEKSLKFSDVVNSRL